mmetsp:Transcript_46486/g.83093  ORF Transcript_46486/g.83093 Transcript_46486/m.83093 type:complete len:124 (-) Transcript_46486:1366-1737(-)
MECGRDQEEEEHHLHWPVAWHGYCRANEGSPGNPGGGAFRCPMERAAYGGPLRMSADGSHTHRGPDTRLTWPLRQQATIPSSHLLPVWQQMSGKWPCPLPPMARLPPDWLRYTAPHMVIPIGA